MKSIGKIDSMNFSSEDIENIFYSDDYIIEAVKSIGVFKPHRWSKAFGKALTKNMIEAKILHTSNGLTLALKRYAVSKSKQTLEFAGLQAYNEKSKLLKELLNELIAQLKHSYITRIDIAIDFKGKVSNKVIKALCNDREAFKYGNTTYYKTKKEKKSNASIDIKKYDKSKKENLSYELERLEFVFKGQYFKKLQIKDLKKAFKKMEKTIKKFAGLEVKIMSFKSL